MHTSVKENITGFQKSFEGFTTWMYLDEKGYVTTGIGNLIDPVSRAVGLPWINPDGSPASQADIVRSWNAVKDKQDWAPKGGGIFRKLPGNDVRLTQAGVARLVQATADSFDKTLTKRWPGYPHWPADGQLAALGIAWAYGPNGLKKLDKALSKLRPDFKAASVIADAAFKREVAKGNKGIEPRRIAVLKAFSNAEKVMKSIHANVDKLYYPSTFRGIAIGGTGIAAIIAAGVGYYFYKEQRT